MVVLSSKILIVYSFYDMTMSSSFAAKILFAAKARAPSLSAEYLAMFMVPVLCMNPPPKASQYASHRFPHLLFP